MFKMLLFAVFNLLLVSALAVTVMPPSLHFMPEDKPQILPTSPTRPCCPPSQWQGNLVDLKSDYQYVTIMAQDYKEEVEGMMTVRTGSEEVVRQTFNDYKNSVSYVVDNFGPKKGFCQKSVLQNLYFGGCENPNPNVIGNQYLGSANLGGDNGVHYDAWIVQYKNNFNVSIGLSTDGCLPIIEKVTTGKAGDSPLLFLFVNVTPTVTIPSLLMKPSAC